MLLGRILPMVVAHKLTIAGDKHMLSNNTYEKLLVNKDDIRCFFNKFNTAATIRHIRNKYGLKIKGRELRDFLGVEPKDHVFVRDLINLAWRMCGWPKKGQYRGEVNRKVISGKRRDYSVSATKTGML